MRRILLTFFTFFTISASAADAVVMCKVIMTEQSQARAALADQQFQFLNEEHQEAIDLKNRIENLELEVQRLRKFNGQYERKSVIEIRRHEQLLDMHLLYNEVSPAVDMYRQVFRDVEFSYVTIKKIESDLTALNENSQTANSELELQGINDQIVELASQREQLIKKFGENFAEYVLIRTKLENLIASGSDSAKNVLMSLGIRNLTNLFPGLALPAERAPLADIKNYFRETPEALIAKLSIDAKDERKLAYISIGFPLINGLRKVLYKLPDAVRRPVTDVIGLSYDVYLRDRYFPDVERILKIPAEKIAERFNLLRELNTKSSDDELLLIFSRLVNAEKSWVQIKDYAKIIAKIRVIDSNFYQKMELADQKAAKLGHLSLYYQASPADKITRLVVAIVTGSAAVYELYGPQVVDQLGALKHFLVGII